MAFFGESTDGTAALQVEAVDTYIKNYHEAAIAVVAESESNFNTLMMAIGLHENKMIRESGECVYNEGALGNFWEKVKKFFVSIIAKVKGIFNSFMSRFDAQFKGGKAFFDKYKTQLAEKFSKVDKDKLKFTGYKFSHQGEANQKLSSIGSDYISKVKGNLSDSEASALIAEREKVDETLEKMRGGLIGTGSYTASEFSKELFQYFRGGQSSKEDVSEMVNFAYLSGVLGTDKLKKTIESSYKNIEKSINDVIKACDSASKSAIDTQVSSDASSDAKGSAQKRTAAYPVVVSILKGAILIKQTYVAAQMQAIANEISQAKGFASQVIRAGVKESASWAHYTEGATDDFLGTVEFK